MSTIPAVMMEDCMIETIGGLLDGVIGAATFIRDTLLRKRERIDDEIRENIVPLHDEFLKIHRGYVRMFKILKAEITHIETDAEQGVIDESAVSEKMQASLAVFCQAREELDEFRMTFRDQIAALVRWCKTPDTQNYLTSLIAYIVTEDTDKRYNDKSEVKHLSERFRNIGGDAIDTPSQALLRRISEERNPTKARVIINESLAGLVMKESQVLDSYLQLRIRQL
jgi:hypothetical protein